LNFFLSASRTTKREGANARDETEADATNLEATNLQITSGAPSTSSRDGAWLGKFLYRVPAKGELGRAVNWAELQQHHTSLTSDL